MVILGDGKCKLEEILETGEISTAVPLYPMVAVQSIIEKSLLTTVGGAMTVGVCDSRGFQLCALKKIDGANTHRMINGIDERKVGCLIGSYDVLAPTVSVPFDVQGEIKEDTSH